jgi:hypothetical protein
MYERIKNSPDSYHGKVKWSDKELLRAVGNELLFTAARSGNLEILKRLNKLGFQNNQIVTDIAAQQGHINVLKYYFTLFPATKQNPILVSYAVFNNKLDTIKYLKEHGAQISEAILISSTEYGDLALFEYLYRWLKETGNRRYLDLDIVNTILLKAGQNNKPEIIDYLVQQQPGVNLSPALSGAIQRNNFELASSLYDRGVSLDDIGLLAIVSQPDLAYIDKFIPTSASKDTLNMVALLAIQRGNLQALKTLFFRGANSFEEFFRVFGARVSEDPEMLQFLLEISSKVDPNNFIDKVLLLRHTKELQILTSSKNININEALNKAIKYKTTLNIIKYLLCRGATLPKTVEIAALEPSPTTLKFLNSLIC